MTEPAPDTTVLRHRLAVAEALDAGLLAILADVETVLAAVLPA